MKNTQHIHPLNKQEDLKNAKKRVSRIENTRETIVENACQNQTRPFPLTTTKNRTVFEMFRLVLLAVLFIYRRLHFCSLSRFIRKRFGVCVRCKIGFSKC